jgi:GNAT superfamily N-acetyltransferase
MTKFDGLDFRQLNLAELKTLVSWAQKEGWNPGANDAEMYFAADPKGFYGVFKDSKMIAGGSIVSYNGKFGFMGLFIVHPEYRGKGIGNWLWFKRRDLLISRLQSGAAIGMDGVEAMEPFYQKGGFRSYYKNLRFSIIASKHDFSSKVNPYTPQHFQSVVELDKKNFGFERVEFLKAWLQNPSAKAFVYEENKKHSGYAVVRRLERNFKFCPLFAENKEVALELFKAGLQDCAGQEILIDVPELNLSGIEMVKDFGGEHVFDCARMYYGIKPELPLKQIYGVTTFELG